jgi:hypothetical protein
MAGFTERFPKLANYLFTIPAVANQRSVGKSLGRIGENGEGEAKKIEFPSLLLGDSMCAKNTDTANIETKGYCHYKSTNGIKRHLLVDVLGNPYFVKCTAANISDDAGLLEIIKENKEYFLNLPDGHIITILLDNGYHKEYLEAEIEKIDKRLRSKIKIELSAKITPEQKVLSKQENPSKQGFVVIAKRWIVERTNAWINQCRSLWKNCEGLLTTSETKIRICAIRLVKEIK